MGGELKDARGNAKQSTNYTTERVWLCGPLHSPRLVPRCEARNLVRGWMGHYTDLNYILIISKLLLLINVLLNFSEKSLKKY